MVKALSEHSAIRDKDRNLPTIPKYQDKSDSKNNKPLYSNVPSSTRRNQTKEPDFSFQHKPIPPTKPSVPLKPQTLEKLEEDYDRLDIKARADKSQNSTMDNVYECLSSGQAHLADYCDPSDAIL